MPSLQACQGTSQRDLQLARLISLSMPRAGTHARIGPNAAINIGRSVTPPAPVVHSLARAVGASRTKFRTQAAGTPHPAGSIAYGAGAARPARSSATERPFAGTAQANRRLATSRGISSCAAVPRPHLQRNSSTKATETTTGFSKSRLSSKAGKRSSNRPMFTAARAVKRTSSKNSLDQVSQKVEIAPSVMKKAPGMHIRNTGRKADLDGNGSLDSALPSGSEHEQGYAKSLDFENNEADCQEPSLNTQETLPQVTPDLSWQKSLPDQLDMHSPEGLTCKGSVPKGVVMTTPLRNAAPNVHDTLRLSQCRLLESGRAADATWREEEFSFGGKAIRIRHACANFYDVKLMGLQVWPCARLLCRYMASRKALFFQHQSVIELGAGTGLCGLLNLKLFGGASVGRTVVITDGPEAPRVLIARNIVAASEERNVHLCQLEWGHHTALAMLPRPQFDLVLASDCVYSRESLELLFETIAELHTKCLILSVSMRNYRLWEETVRLAAARGLKLVEPLTVPEENALEAMQAAGGMILRFEATW